MLIGEKITLYVMLTRACNLKCSFCFQRGLRQSSSIDLNTLLQFIYNTPQIDDLVIQGGEAFLLESELLSLLSFVQQLNTQGRSLTIGFITNGTIYFSWLKDYKKYITDVQISIDGGAECHNANRIYKANSEGSYDQVLSNLYKYAADGLPLSIHSVISSQTRKLFIRSQKQFYSDVPKHIPIRIELEHLQRVPIWSDLLTLLALKKSFQLASKLGNTVIFNQTGSEALGCKLCPLGATILCVDMSSGNLYSCEEKIGDEEFRLGSIFASPSYIKEELFYQSLKRLDISKYRIQFLSKRMSEQILKRASFNICPALNKNKTGEEFVIPISSLFYYWLFLR